HLFQALQHVCLVPKGFKPSHHRFSRGGRTDAGVSASGQVVALWVRAASMEGSATVRGVQNIPQDMYLYNRNPRDSAPEAPMERELNYCKMLNSALPQSVAVRAWSPVHVSFHSRFNATGRSYRYLIPDAARLDVPAMQRAAQDFQGEHDFTNFCKADLETYSHHDRVMRTVSVTRQPDASVAVAVQGTAFLYHQVRCMVAILMRVGSHLESVSIVRRMLSREPPFQDKPTYAPASPFPLCLVGVMYPENSFRWWVSPPFVSAPLACHLQRAAEYEARAAVMRVLASDIVDDCDQDRFRESERESDHPDEACLWSRSPGFHPLTLSSAKPRGPGRVTLRDTDEHRDGAETLNAEGDYPMYTYPVDRVMADMPREPSMKTRRERASVKFADRPAFQLPTMEQPLRETVRNKDGVCVELGSDTALHAEGVVDSLESTLGCRPDTDKVDEPDAKRRPDSQASGS
ncbi:pseudouridine synthase I, TruA, partial [Kipferlia bialata]